MRQYEQVWVNVKNSPLLTCSISAHKAHHRRIIKAVKKEKNMDLAYKLECSELTPSSYAVMSSSRSGSVVTFTVELKTYDALTLLQLQNQLPKTKIDRLALKLGL